MREIKFRVWSNQLKKLVYPSVTGWFDDCFIGRNGAVQTCSLDITLSKNGKELELMQFTGLHDKNGTEIYEGDILTNYDKEFGPGEYQKVYWSDEYARFCCDKWALHGMSNLLTVWGNIYEHPDLLAKEATHED